MADDEVASGPPTSVFPGVLRGVSLTEDGVRFASSAVLQLFEIVPAAISVTAGPTHRLVYANRRYRDALIDPDVEPLGRPLREIFGEFLPSDTYAIRDRVLAEGRALAKPEEPIPPHSPAPSYYWDVGFYPLADEGGVPTGVLTFAVDVTGRVRARREAEERAEAERRRAEEATLDRARLALAVDATSLGIWEWNVETGETIWSDTQKAIWGMEPEHDASYERWRASIHPEDRDVVLQRVERTLDPSSGGDQILEHRIVRPSGAVRWISSHGRMLYDEESGKPLRLIGTVLDITRRKNDEDALTKALESQEILLREVNHRVKNSLQLVSSMLALQSSRLDDPGLRSLVQEAQLRIQAVAAAHERLYRSRDLRSVDLDVFLGEFCRDLERSVADPSDAVVVEVETEPVTIANDRAVPLALILNELLTNAIKYAYPDRRGTILVSLARGENGRARLAVSDDGVGLPEDFPERQRTSLGYRIIEGLVRQIEGELEIAERTPGTAVVVHFDLAS